jgi:Uma2 family endonuclease
MAISERPDLIQDGDDRFPSKWDGQRMSLDKFLALPEEKPALEYSEGVVRQKMAPTADHAEIQFTLTSALSATANQQQLGRAFSEIRFTYEGVSYVPDVGYYRRERLQTRSGRRYARDLGPPDIAIEVVSPEQRLSRLIQKCVKFLALGTTVALIVDPEDDAVLAFRAGQLPQVLRGDDRIDLDDVLPGFQMTVAQLFQSILPDWLDEPPDIEPDQPTVTTPQADDAAASGRSEG